MLKNLLKRFQNTSESNYSEPSLMNTFARLPVSFTHGKGCHLWDTEDKQYIDALGGIAVTILGHSHPKISEVISLQASRLLHVSNLFRIPEQLALGEKFSQISGMEKTFFCNSGAEANEAAIKIARLYANNKGIKNPTIIAAQKAFHGRTMAALAATGNPALQKGFEPMLSEFIHVPYNDSNAVKTLSDNADVVAVMVEPIQGEGGIIVPDDNYLSELRAICDANGWLLILDEIQTGIGRTGKWFAYQHTDIKPDVITSAKALANGVPIGACAATGIAADVLGPGTHGTTFGGNPFACAVALATLEIIETEGLIDNVNQVGAAFKKSLQQNLGTHSKVVDIRGKGMMLGVELDEAYPDLAKKFLDAGLVVNITGAGKVIRMLPAAILDEKTAKQITGILLDVINGL
jgi:acetylornithine aminotransferase